jgi:hypothetical protein
LALEQAASGHFWRIDAHCLAVPLSLGVILRHDRPDTDCLADERDWPAIMTFFGGDGAGTLIADRWLLTAAHTARSIPVHHRVAVGGRPRRVVGAVLHPDGDDLAVVELDRPVDGVDPLALHERADEAGAEALLLGRGDFGNGRDGVLGADGRLRCVTNRIDGADERWLRLRFDPPPDCTALEGVGGEGDSGGPALLRNGDRLTVAGVSSWQDHDGPLGTYGCVEHYARVCTRVGWIRSAIG